MKIKFLRPLLIILLVLPVAFLWGELFVHILLPQNVDSVLSIVQPDPVVGYIYQPNAKASETGREYQVSYVTNSFGLRDREYDLNEKVVFRVLLFGDSFSESHGLILEKSLPKQLESYLQKELNRTDQRVRVEVVNASFGGYSPYHYWKSYERWKSIFKPDLVLIGFYMGNDFQCEDDTIRYRIDEGEIIGTYKEGEAHVYPRTNTLSFVRKWLARKSELYVLMRNFFYYNDTMGLLTRRAIAKESTKQLSGYVLPEPEELKFDRGKCLGYLKRLKHETAADGVPLAILTIPTKFEIDRIYLEQIVNSQSLHQNTLDLDLPYKILNEFCHATNIALLNPRMALKLHQVKEPCYFQYDGHWNAKGIEVAAVSAVQQWEEQRLPPFQ